jgi:hypothetical protein
VPAGALREDTGMELSFFHRSGDALVPHDMARSSWSKNQMHGVAVSGALAQALERRVQAAGRGDLQPARLTVDLFRPATMEPCQVAAEVVREGQRIILVDAVLTQGGEPVARAGALFLKSTRSAPGEVWEPTDRPAPPPLDVVPASEEPRVPFFHSSAGWSQDFSAHQNPSRKTSWNTAVPIVRDEPVSAFQAAASMADGASMVTNWGSGGVEYINTDITLTLARQPAGLEIGLAAVDRVEHDGIAAGTAAVFDRAGPLGTAVVTALANARRAVDFDGVTYNDDGERRSTRV